MRSLCLAVTLALALAAPAALAGTCTGSPDCRVCHDCSRCYHCNEGGGTCGVKQRVLRLHLKTRAPLKPAKYRHSVRRIHRSAK